MAQIAADEGQIYYFAKQHFKYESIRSEEEKRAFDTFFQKTQDGEQADLTPDLKTVTDTLDSKILTDPVYAVLWQRDRVIQAEWLNWLCTDTQASAKVTSKGIQITRARIVGDVKLSWVKIEFPLRTYECAFTGAIDLNRAILRTLDLQSTHIKGLDGDGLSIERDLICSDGFQAEGRVWLRDERIGGSVKCDGRQFINPQQTALNLESAKTGPVFLKVALNLENGKIVGKPFRAEGKVVLDSATISGNLACDGGVFINSGEVNSTTNKYPFPLRADEVRVDGDVYLRDRSEYSRQRPPEERLRGLRKVGLQRLSN
jgi:hypothetical protein